MTYTFLHQIYLYRELIKALAAKEVKIKYKSAALGWLWSLLNPLLLMLIFSLVFTLIIKVKIENFPVFLLSALLPWFYLSFSLNSATTSIVDNATLIKKAYFPHEVIPISIVLANLFNFLISLMLLFGFLLIFGIYPALSWFYLPLVVILQTIFVIGLCLLASALHALFRDIKYAVELILLVWFYATPIFYPLSFVPQNLRPIFYCNPLTIFIKLYRTVLLEGRIPQLSIIVAASIISLIFYWIGTLVFQKQKKNFADVT